MIEKTIEEVHKILNTAIDQKIKYRLIDERWKKRGDIDIIINSEDINKFEEILKQEEFKLKGKKSKYARAYKKNHNNESINFGIHIGGYNNVFGLREKKFVKLFEPKTLCEKEKYYLITELQILITLYKVANRRIMIKGFSAEKYQEYYEKLLQIPYDENKLNELIDKIFSNKETIIQDIKKHTKLDEIELKLKPKHQRREKTTKQLHGLSKYLYKTLHPAPMIAIIGTDGSGKSTTIKKLSEKLDQNKIKNTIIYAGRGKEQILPIKKIGGIFTTRKKNKIKKKTGQTELDRKTEVMIEYKNPIIKILTTKLYFLEYLMKYWFKILPARKKYDIVILDRSYIDMFVSPNTTQWLVKIYYKLLPKPTHIQIYADAITANKRNPRHPIEDIERQINIYNKIQKEITLKINSVENNPEEISEQIYALLVKKNKIWNKL